MAPTAVFVMVGMLIATCLYLAVALLYVHWAALRRMDFFDLLRRLGPATVYLALAFACVLLILGIGPEWRLPPIVLAMVMTALGMSRDVRRERIKRKGR